MSIAKAACGLLWLWLAFTIYSFATAKYRACVRPAVGRYTYRDFVAANLPAKEARALATPAGYICIFGERLPPWMLPSGPPGYLFDSHGILIDFTHDVGDSPKFKNEWRVYSGEPIPLQTLRVRLGSDDI